MNIVLLSDDVFKCIWFPVFCNQICRLIIMYYHKNQIWLIICIISFQDRIKPKPFLKSGTHFNMLCCHDLPPLHVATSYLPPLVFLKNASLIRLLVLCFFHWLVLLCGIHILNRTVILQNEKRSQRNVPVGALISNQMNNFTISNLPMQ